MAKKKKRKTPPRYKSGPEKGKFMSKRAVAAKRARGKGSAKKKSKAPTKRGKTKTTMAKKKSKKKSRRRSSKRGASGISQGEVKDLMVGGAIYGYITEDAGADEGSMKTSVVEALEKVPVVGNRDISNGLALWAIDRYVFPNKYLRMTAKAALVSGAVRFGRRGFTLGGAGEETGWDDAIDVTEQGSQVSGIID